MILFCLLCVRIETDQLLSNISLIVGQLYADKSFALRAYDLLCSKQFYITLHTFIPLLKWCKPGWAWQLLF